YRRGCIMIDWVEVSQGLDFPGPKEMWEELYTNRGLSTTKLAAQFGVGVNTITKELRKHEIAIRKRGGKNYQRIKPEEVEGLRVRVEAEGIQAVADSFNPPLSPTTLYKRLFYSQGERRRRPLQSAEPSAVEPADPPAADVRDESR